MTHHTLIEVSSPALVARVILGLPVLVRTVAACQAAGSLPQVVTGSATAAPIRNLLDQYGYGLVPVGSRVSGNPSLKLQAETQYDPEFVKKMIQERRENPDTLFARVSPVLWQRLDGSELAYKQAEQKLFAAIRCRTEGWVAPRLNKPVSFFITRFLVRTGVTPNQITFANLGLAFIAAVLLASPSWSIRVLGAALMQFTSIVDGCDGEVARLKFKFSKIGGWLDTIADDVSNNAFFVGLFVGLYRTTGSVIYTRVGILSVVLSLGVSLLIYQQLLTTAKSANARDFKPTWDQSRGLASPGSAPMAPQIPFALQTVPSLMLATPLKGGHFVEPLEPPPQRDRVAGWFDSSGKSWFEWIRPIAKRDFFIFVIFLAQILNWRVGLFWLGVGVTGITFGLYAFSLFVSLRQTSKNNIP